MTLITIAQHDGSENAADVVANLQRASHLLRGLLTPHFAEFGLTDIRYTALKIVQSAPTPGCTQTLLADKLQQSESSVSTLVERMRADGLLYRMTSQLDRRKRVLMLSEQARTLLNDIDQCHNERMQEIVKGLTPQQQVQLGDLLHRLVEELSYYTREAAQSLKFPWQSPQQTPAQPTIHQTLPIEQNRRAA